MTKDTLIKYYLTVGASYRKSKEWSKDYTKEKKSIVPRTGKFGVGVLASFLLGKCVSVQTKNIDDDFGCSFSFSLGDSIIDVTRDKNIEVGTIVRISIDDEILEQMVCRQTIYSEGEFSRIVTGSFTKVKRDIRQYQSEGCRTSYGNSPNLDFSALNDEMQEKGKTKYFIPFVWYLGAEPILDFEIDGQIESTPITLPKEENHLSGWFSLKEAPFFQYLWSYSNPFQDIYKAYDIDYRFHYNDYNPLKGLFADDEDRFHRHDKPRHPLFYNGIIVPDTTFRDEKSNYSLKFNIPILSLTDLDSEKSKFTITLNRNSCVFPNLDLLYREQVKYFFVALLTCPYNVLNHGVASISGLYSKVDFIFFKNGFITHHKLLLSILNIQKIYGILADVDEIRNHCSKNAFVKLVNKDIKRIDEHAHADDKHHGFVYDWGVDNYKLKENNMRINWDSNKKGTLQTKLPISNIPKALQNLKSLKLVEFLLPKDKKKNENDEYKSKPIFGERFDDIYKPEEIVAMQNRNIDEYLSQFIREFLNNDILIPYLIPERRTKYKKAFEELTKYIEYWEEEWKNYKHWE